MEAQEEVDGVTEGVKRLDYLETNAKKLILRGEVKEASVGVKVDVLGAACGGAEVEVRVRVDEADVLCIS
ncbi:hypothetical protein E2C01_100830 [Portunus trituberculatus]|uniref:Uncharacterized protein n=1 Tax=Portunus trituberculatus TaxID=210409 RepID=A0A5B7K920_PORTR|nr:hypothetical protein [Portunus trituberculatus]